MKQILSSLLLIALVAGAYWLGTSHGRITIENGLQTDTTKIDVVFPDSLPQAPPVERRLYKEVVDTTWVRVPVPTRYRSNMTFAAPSPINVSSSQVTLRRWDVESRRFVDDVYRVPVPDYSFGVYSDLTVWKRGYSAFAGPYMRYKRGFISPGIVLHEGTASFGLRAGLIYTF